MGNIMSGRSRSLRNYQFTYDYYKLDIRQLRKLGLLQPGLTLPWHTFVKEDEPLPIHVEEDGLIAHIQHSADNKLTPYRIEFDYTECHLGGRWLSCPVPYCQTRVAVLYYNGLFMCRHCRKLRYESQSMSAKNRAYRQAKKIRDKLGWPNCVAINHPKPKHMRCATYLELIWKHEACMAKGMNLSKSRS